MSGINNNPFLHTEIELPDISSSSSKQKPSKSVDVIQKKENSSTPTEDPMASITGGSAVKRLKEFFSDALKDLSSKAIHVTQKFNTVQNQINDLDRAVLTSFLSLEKKLLPLSFQPIHTYIKFSSEAIQNFSNFQKKCLAAFFPKSKK